MKKLAQRVLLPCFEAWALLTDHRRYARRNVLVSAIPRSGSSLFISLLNRIPNVVALNELGSTPYPAWFFRQTRRRIQRGLPVLNKFSSDGKLTTDTIDSTTRSEKEITKVLDGDFILAHKSTLAYLNRIEEFVRRGWDIHVLVRHPLYAIGSWTRCPPHFSVARLNPPDKLFAHVPFSSEDPDVRRVELWNHYAALLNRWKDDIVIIKYEDLVDDVQALMNRFCMRYDLPVTTFEPLQSRNRADTYTGLTDKLVNLMRERCQMDLLDYQMP